ncbi:MAG: chloride channel protein [Nitrospirota bacterium]|nr:chloride channel protein [Nitrospirota bacterium]MDH5586156.1 chloride channel protein [Nitrospirota bacterium]MDH5775656.1 chloride channel protein [Nitrospirota bacterium]
MIRQVSEEGILFTHVLKWLFLAAIVGLLVGMTSTGFVLFLNLVIETGANAGWTYWLLPIGLALSAWITSSLVPEAGGQGVEQVVRAIHLRSGKMRWQVIPAKIVATLLTIGVGGSAGNVGPCVQIGSGLSSFFSDTLSCDLYDRKTLVICGVSAGFAAILGAPLAGALFGLEVLFVGSLAYQVLLPSVVAALIGHITASSLGMPDLHFVAAQFPPFHPALLLFSLLAGGIFGLVSMIFVECLNGGKRLMYHIQVSPPIQGAVGGVLLLGMGWLVSPEILGLGKETIQRALEGGTIVWALVLGKMLTTALTLNVGGSGGIVLPICFVGATSGSILGWIFGHDPSLFAALGLTGLLAGAINIPLTAFVLGLELFGLTSGPYLLLSCTIAYLLSGHRSAIPTQLLQFRKAPALHGPINQEIGEQSRFEKHGEMDERNTGGTN